MESEKAEGLQWFIDFANIDLDNIKPGDKAKLLVEAEERLWPKTELKQYEIFSLLPEEMAWASKIPPRHSKEYWSAILQSQKTVRGNLQRYILPTVIVKDKSAKYSSIFLRGDDKVLWFVSKGANVPYSIRFFPICKSQDDYLLLKVLMMLDGFPQHAITVCPGCEKFFFNPTGRKKRFCGDRCMWRITTAIQRAKDREGYNEYQAGLMKARYREKTLGPGKGKKEG